MWVIGSREEWGAYLELSAKQSQMTFIVEREGSILNSNDQALLFATCAYICNPIPESRGFRLAKPKIACAIGYQKFRARLF